MKPHKLLKKTAALLLTLSLLPTLPLLQAAAAEPQTTEYSMTVSTGEPRLLHSTQNSSVQLIDGTAVQWIDRVVLSDDMRKLYDILVEGADADGYQDILIDDSYLDEDYMIEIKSKSFALTSFDRTAEIETAAYAFLDAEHAPIYAVLSAFDRDHPEVFWLNGNYTISCSPSVSGSVCTLTLLLKLQNDGETVRTSAYSSDTQIRAAIAQRNEAVNAILSNLSATNSVSETLLYFNNTLTKTNQYNTSYNLNNIPPDCRECIAALDGRIGQNGPICESYARAFKVLCDAKDIPCVLVDGEAINSAGDREGHMWNYVQVGSFWYAVDVTWNDPSSYFSSGALSGDECTDWFLVGGNTQVGDRTFLASHPVMNQAYENAACFPNGPTLSADRYTDSISVIPVLSDEGLVYDGTAHTPEILVKNGANIIDESFYTVSYSDNIKPGTATVTVSIASGVYAGSYTASFVIRKRPLEILPDAPTRVYDGTTKVALTPQYDASALVAGDEFDLTLRGEFSSPNVGTNIPLSVHIEEMGEDMRFYDLILPDRLFGTITKATLPDLSEQAGTISFSPKGFTKPTFLGADGAALTGSYSYYFGDWGPFTHEQLSAKLSACLSEKPTDDPVITAMKEALLSDGSLSIRCSFFDSQGNYGEHSTLLTFTPAEKREEATDTSEEKTPDTAETPNGSSNSSNRGTTSQGGDTVLKLILFCALGSIALIPTGLVTFVIIFFAVRGHKNKKAKKEAERQQEDQSR
ncbi:MAG: hypothetical protein E7668_01270 [Ruminococcaceae bacterium]|nr:hypothetical protein [Oscillospiraceae bacterium]